MHWSNRFTLSPGEEMLQELHAAELGQSDLISSMEGMTLYYSMLRIALDLLGVPADRETRWYLVDWWFEYVAGGEADVSDFLREAHAC
tara:strand:+ start:17659 stop:17922 length:264 start_codon:yes stop_codon:yes gene_type:complete